MQQGPFAAVWLQNCKGFQAYLHSLPSVPQRPGNWVTGDLKNRGMQSHCFLTKLSIPSEAHSNPFNGSRMTAEGHRLSMHQDPLEGLLKHRSPAPCPSTFPIPKVRVGPQCFPELPLLSCHPCPTKHRSSSLPVTLSFLLHS